MTGYMSADDCRLSDLVDLVSQKTSLDEYPYAQAVEENVLIYDGPRLRAALSRATERPRVEAELARALSEGPGIVMLARAFADSWVIDRATRQFEAILAAQRTAGRAWLGPGYQVTSQVNVVNPGSAAQHGHRDYHLGFASAERAAQFPAHVHQLSPALKGTRCSSTRPCSTRPTPTGRPG
jgi:hypothetical protein